MANKFIQLSEAASLAPFSDCPSVRSSLDMLRSILDMLREAAQQLESQPAQARLIAAAPDLLEALIAMEAEKANYMLINKLGDPAGETTNRMARAAIAKATGEGAA